MKRFTTFLFLVCLPLLAAPAGADDRRKARPLNERALVGTYVFAGRVLLNPVVPQGPQQQQPPQRLPVDCFSIGELRFDGRGTIKRRIEIRCPATANLLGFCLGAPPPDMPVWAIKIRTRYVGRITYGAWTSASSRGCRGTSRSTTRALPSRTIGAPSGS